MMLRRPLRIGLARLSLLSVFVGLITGAGAVLFRALIGLIHNIAFLGSFAVNYDARRPRALGAHLSSWFLSSVASSSPS
jgi:hypothetical protein